MKMIVSILLLTRMSLPYLEKAVARINQYLVVIVPKAAVVQKPNPCLVKTDLTAKLRL